jgi:CDP-6-deoxy-D-xylo-4-hexulose-3-dehydrase
MASETRPKVWYAPHGLQAYGEHEIQAVEKCLRAGWLAGTGEASTAFEARVARMFGKRKGLFVNSGSSACLLALACLQLPPGSEVVTPACTFATTVAPIVQLGLKPVFIDVESTTYVPSVASVMASLTLATRAVMLPNLIGSTPDWPGLRRALRDADRSDVVLIEDSADTLPLAAQPTILDGEQIVEGSDLATTSFYSSHMVTACGSGGMVMFNSDELLRRATMFRDWGRVGDNSEVMSERFAHDVDGIPYDYKFLYDVLGYNMKASEVNAAFGLAQLDRLDAFVAARRRNVDRYMARLADLAAEGRLTLPDDAGRPNWLAMPLRCPGASRLELLRHLEDANIQTRVTFSGNITRHPAFRQYLGEFPVSDDVMRHGFLVGCHQGMNEEDVDYVCDTIRAFFVRATDAAGVDVSASSTP